MMNLTHSEFSLSLQNCYLKVRNYILRCIDNCELLEIGRSARDSAMGLWKLLVLLGFWAPFEFFVNLSTQCPLRNTGLLFYLVSLGNYSGVLKSASLLVYLSCLPRHIQLLG